MTIFGRITFVPTLAYNIILEKFSSRQWYNRVDQNIILGALPWKSICSKLVEEENVKGVISMNMDYELYSAVANKDYWNKLNVKFLQLSTPDIFHSPSNEQIDKGIDFIKEIVKNGDTVYVHCKAGRTRSASLVGCYLIETYNYTPEEAVNFMKEKRPHVLLKSKQKETMQKFYEKHLKKENK